MSTSTVTWGTSVPMLVVISTPPIPHTEHLLTTSGNYLFIFTPDVLRRRTVPYVTARCRTRTVPYGAAEHRNAAGVNKPLHAH